MTIKRNIDELKLLNDSICIIKDRAGLPAQAPVELVYCYDFGPLNLAHVYRYCMKLKAKLESLDLQQRRIIHYTSIHVHKIANAAFLLGCYQVICLHRSPSEAYNILCSRMLHPYFPFRDASSERQIKFELSILDCLMALEKALFHKFFALDTFCAEEYERIEQVCNGDMSWIVPGKFLAFSSPQDPNAFLTDFYTSHPPSFYIPYFRKNNVSTVLRLNEKTYEESEFIQAGIDHFDLYFRDGTSPPEHIMLKFLEITERARGAVAIHCKAGLGRTGALIGAYLMKHYRMTGLETLGWLRICRPGSVLGSQQNWLVAHCQQLWEMGNAERREKVVKTLPSTKTNTTVVRTGDGINRPGKQGIVNGTGRLIKSSLSNQAGDSLDVHDDQVKGRGQSPPRTIRTRMSVRKQSNPSSHNLLGAQSNTVTKTINGGDLMVLTQGDRLRSQRQKAQRERRVKQSQTSKTPLFYAKTNSSSMPLQDDRDDQQLINPIELVKPHLLQSEDQQSIGLRLAVVSNRPAQLLPLSITPNRDKNLGGGGGIDRPATSTSGSIQQHAGVTSRPVPASLRSKTSLGRRSSRRSTRKIVGKDSLTKPMIMPTNNKPTISRCLTSSNPRPKSTSIKQQHSIGVGPGSQESILLTDPRLQPVLSLVRIKPSLIASSNRRHSGGSHWDYSSSTSASSSESGLQPRVKRRSPDPLDSTFIALSPRLNTNNNGLGVINNGGLLNRCDASRRLTIPKLRRQLSTSPTFHHPILASSRLRVRSTTIDQQGQNNHRSSQKLQPKRYFLRNLSPSPPLLSPSLELY